MSYLQYFQRLFVNYIKKKTGKEIPLKVDSEELLIRGIVHPLFYSISQKTIKREALLPPPNRSDVSILRHRYTSDDFCKNHSKNLKLGENQYCGLASFLQKNVVEINSSDGNTTMVEVKASPIDSRNAYIVNGPIFVDDPGLPMHADVIYDSPIVKGEVQTRFRAYAQRLCKLAKYFHDPDPVEPKWTGEKLC